MDTAQLTRVTTFEDDRAAVRTMSSPLAATLHAQLPGAAPCSGCTPGRS